MPLTIYHGRTSGSPIWVESEGEKKAFLGHWAENLIGPGYFDTLGIPLRQGRDFTRSDDAERAGCGDRQRGVRKAAFRRALAARPAPDAARSQGQACRTRSSASPPTASTGRSAKIRCRRSISAIRSGRPAPASLHVMARSHAVLESSRATSAGDRQGDRRSRPERRCGRADDEADTGVRASTESGGRGAARQPRIHRRDARDSRPVRDALLHGDAAHTRDRHPHGARRDLARRSRTWSRATPRFSSPSASSRDSASPR